MAMTFDEALAQPGSRVQAWDVTQRAGGWVVSIYSLSEQGAKQLAMRHVPLVEREAVEADLLARGLPLAASDHQSDFIWQEIPNGLAVYDGKQRALLAMGNVVRLGDGREHERGVFRRVIAFAADDYVARGVKAALENGEVTLLVDYSMSAMNDPGYGRNELLFETEWCGTLAQLLAAWADVPYENQI